jgi:hypothetical protein
MFEALLERFLADYVGEYVVFDSKNLHVSVWAGDM